MLRTSYLIIFEVLVFLLSIGSVIFLKTRIDMNDQKKVKLFSFTESIILIIGTSIFVVNLLIDLFVSGSILPKLIIVNLAGVIVCIVSILLYKNKLNGEMEEENNPGKTEELTAELTEEIITDFKEIEESKEEVTENEKIVEQIMSVTEEKSVEISDPEEKEDKEVKADEKNDEKNDENKREEKSHEDKEVVKKAAQLKAAKIAAAKKVQKEKAEKIETAKMKEKN